MTDTPETPDCPSNAAHGKMTLRPPAGQTAEQQWCGIWYDCQRCHSSILQPSPELRAQLADQADAAS